MINASSTRIDASTVEEGTAILTRRDFKVRRLHNLFLTRFGGRDMNRTKYSRTAEVLRIPLAQLNKSII